MNNKMRHGWVPIVVWIILMIFGLITSITRPDILRENTATHGILFSLLAWWPAFMVWGAVNT